MESEYAHRLNFFVQTIATHATEIGDTRLTNLLTLSIRQVNKHLAWK